MCRLFYDVLRQSRNRSAKLVFHTVPGNYHL